MPGVDVNDASLESDNVSDPPTPNECNEIEVEAKSEPEILETNKSDEEEEWSDILGNGQLKMKVLRKGEPNTRPQCPDICTIKLTGKLEDGKVVEKHDSLRIQLGDYEVVQGLELALPLMNVGDETLVIVSPRFSYGSIGNPPDIPPDSTITYTVELIKVELEPDLEKIPYEERRSLADSKRARGNWWYSRQDATKAVQCYRRARDILDENVLYIDENGKPTENASDVLKNIIQEKLKIYNNLAAAQLMMEAYETALSSVNEVIKHDPKNVKALFRKSKILTAKGCVNEAVETLRQAFLLEPENTAVRMELSRCVKLQQIEKQHEKILYKKMLGQSSKSKKDSDRSKGKSIVWTKVLGTVATATLMAAVAFAISYKFKNLPFM